MIHQVIKGVGNLQRKSYALLKQSKIRCFLHVRQVLFLNRYTFYFLLVSPKFTVKLKLPLWKVPPRTKPLTNKSLRAVLNEIENKLISITRIADGSWLEGAEGGATAD